MNIGDAVKVLWAGYTCPGEIIGFDRGDAVVAFDTTSSNGTGVRIYQRLDNVDVEPVIPAARITPRPIPQDVIDEVRAEHGNDLLNRARHG
jgi:hypothetical protein